MSSCLHVMSMSSHSACLVFPGPTGANHLDLQISSLDGKDAEDAASPLPVCAKSSITLTANLAAENPWCRNWESDLKKRSHTQKSKTMKVQPLLNCPLDTSTKKNGTNHLNPIQNTGIVLWKKRVQQNRTHSFSGQGRFSKRSPASSSSFLAKQSWYLRLKKWAPNSMYGTSGQGLL